MHVAIIPRLSIVILILLLMLLFMPLCIAEEPTLKWAYQFNSRISSSPVLSNGLIYLGSWDGKVYEMNTFYGTQQGNFHAYPSGIFSTPLYHDNTIYFGDDGGYFHAVDVIGDAKNWNFKAGENADTSPLLYNGMIVFGTDEKVFALRFT